MFSIDDPVFGQLRAEINAVDGLGTVAGDAIPHATLRRTSGARPDRRVPIGTRDATGLAMTVGEAPVTLAIGPGRLKRRTYEVAATFRGSDYILRPRTALTSRLLCDRRRIGDLQVDGQGGAVIARWRDCARPADAAIGYLLAVGFGVGARHPVQTFLLALLEGGAGGP